MATGLGGEMGWWCPSLDDAGNGTTTLTDLSGNGKTGTLTNMDAATDWVADTTSGGIRAIDFDGVDDYIATTLRIGVVSNLSISAWLKPRSTVSRMQVTQGTSSSFGIHFEVAADGNFYFWPAFVNDRSLTNWSAFGANWIHFVVLFDGTGSTNADRVKMYINAIPRTIDFVGTMPAATGNYASDLRIGSSPTGTTVSDGLFDDVRIWNRTLTLVEIAQMQSQRAFQPGSGGSAGFTGIRGTTRTLGT